MQNHIRQALAALILTAVTLLLPIRAGHCQEKTPAKRPPNIVFFLADDK